MTLTLTRWRYGAEQRAAIRVEIAAILGKE